MKIVVRDDDTCGFTSPEDLRSCYESIWGEIPVSLSVTPLRIPGNDRNVPAHLFGNMDIIPLADNTELVAYLQQGIADGRLDISLHGYHHLKYNDLPEFVAGDALLDRAINGKRYLEDLFDVQVRSFVPPHNSIGMEGLEAVTQAGMNLVGVPSLWSGAVRKRSVKAIINMPRFYWHEKIMKKRYPYILDFGTHREVSFHTAGPKTDYADLVRQLEYCHRHSGVFVLSTHYHAFERATRGGDTVRKVIFQLLDRAAAYPDIEFVGINSIW